MTPKVKLSIRRSAHYHNLWDKRNAPMLKMKIAVGVFHAIKLVPSLAAEIFGVLKAICMQPQKRFKISSMDDLYESFLPLDEAIASRAIFVIVSESDGRADGNAFGAS